MQIYTFTKFKQKMHLITHINSILTKTYSNLNFKLAPIRGCVELLC